MKQSKYFFGIIKNHSPRKLGSIKDKKLGRVYSIPYRDIRGVVGHYPDSRFDWGTREEVAKKLVRHQTIIEKVMKDFAIIPIKFGTLLGDEEEVKKVLQKGYKEFKESLEKFKKKIELDLAVSWEDFNSEVKKVVNENEKIRRFKEEIAEKQKTKDVFQEKVKIGSLIKEVMDQKKQALQEEITGFISQKIKVEDRKEHELMNDNMILNCAFLLDRDEEEAFEKVLNELNTRYKDSLKFRCVGPLPLYSFSTFQIDRINFEQIDHARKLLKLPEEFTAEDVRKAYRCLVKDKHPDKGTRTHEAQKGFEEIQRAYRLMMDYCGDEKRSLQNENFQDDFSISVFDTRDIS
ncbi:GvpL/GvpF family gas vesicle protein [bacterium]|nr:GvpL/GvpF family gas vesicle protein [bacterium]